MSGSHPGGSCRDEGGSLPLDSVSRPFTTSPRASRHPLRFSQRAGSRPLPTRLVKSAPCHGPRYFPSGDVGAPHLLADERGEPFRLCERAVYQRTSIPWALPPWSDETPPFTRRSATSRLATYERFLLRASPCPRAFCGLPHGRPEKTTLLWTTTFRPNSATRFDARARPIRATAPLHLGLATPQLAMCHLAIAITGEPCPSASSPRRGPRGLVLPARCFTGVRRSHHWNGCMRTRGSRSRPLSFANSKTATCVEALSLAEFRGRRHGPKVPSEGLARSTPRFGGVRCECPSSRAFEHPSVADLVRAVLEWSRAC